MNSSKAKLPLIRIVDDDKSIRKALTFLLETEGWEVISYENPKEFLSSDTPSRTGCVILDVSMPEINGIELYEMLRERNYETPIIFLTGHGDIDMAVQAMKDGAIDFLQKPIDEERLLAAVAKAIKWDETHRGWSIDPNEEKARFESLTKREKEVVSLLAKGLINKEIAQRLNLSERTVEVHRQNACKKLKVQSSSDISLILSHLNSD